MLVGGFSLFYMGFMLGWIPYHLTLSAQYAADILPLAILAAWRALKARFRAVPSGEPVTPCCPNRISFTWFPDLASTACDLVGWFGVRFGLLYPAKDSRPRCIMAFPFGLVVSFVQTVLAAFVLALLVGCSCW